jgi:hypothetical protein
MFLVALPGQLAAQVFLNGSLGYGKALSERGPTLGGGLAAKAGPFVVFAGGDGLVYPVEDDGRYY